MAYRSSTSNSGNAPTNHPSAAVPAGVAIGDIVIAIITIDQQAATVEAGDLPTGWVSLNETDITADGQTAWIGWKRLSAVDSGTYQWGDIGGGDWVCEVFAWSGRHGANPPVVSSVNVVNTAANDPTVSANGVTALAGDDLFWGASADTTVATAGFSFTPPTGYTEAKDVQLAWATAAGAYKDNVSAGATGTVSGAMVTPGTATAGYAAWLVRIPAAGGGTYTLDATGGSYAVSGTVQQLKLGRKAVAVAGSYTLTGSPASPRKGPLISAVGGAYTLTGSAATFKSGRKAIAIPGAYAVLGTRATPRWSGAPSTGTPVSGPARKMSISIGISLS